MQLLWQLLQAASTEHTCTLILLRTETGSAIPAIGEDRTAEPDARPLQALRLPGQEKMEGSIASPRLEPARQRQRLDRAGAGRPATRALQADLVDAEEAEPDARPEDMELVLP